MVKAIAPKAPIGATRINDAHKAEQNLGQAGDERREGLGTFAQPGHDRTEGHGQHHDLYDVALNEGDTMLDGSMCSIMSMKPLAAPSFGRKRSSPVMLSVDGSMLRPAPG